MDNIILIGSVIFAIGVIINILNAKWSWKTGEYTRVKNRKVALIGWLFLLIGILIIVLKAYANGQFL